MTGKQNFLKNCICPKNIKWTGILRMDRVTGISLKLRSRRNLNNFLECRSLALQRTAFAEESSISVLLHRQLPRLVRRGGVFHGEERRGFVTSAHPFNHHFQGHAKMKMTFLKRPVMAAFFDSRTCRCRLLALYVVIFV